MRSCTQRHCRHEPRSCSPHDSFSHMYEFPKQKFRVALARSGKDYVSQGMAKFGGSLTS